MLIANLNVNIKYKSITPSKISFSYGVIETFRSAENCLKINGEIWLKNLDGKIEDKIR